MFRKSAIIVLVSLSLPFLTFAQNVAQEDIKELKEQYLYLFNQVVEMRAQLDAQPGISSSQVNSRINELRNEINAVNRRVSQLPADRSPDNVNDALDSTLAGINNRMGQIEAELSAIAQNKVMANNGNGGSGYLSEIIFLVVILIMSGFVLWRMSQYFHELRVNFSGMKEVVREMQTQNISMYRAFMDRREMNDHTEQDDLMQGRHLKDSDMERPEVTGEEVKPAATTLFPEADEKKISGIDEERLLQELSVAKNTYKEVEEEIRVLNELKNSYISRLLRINYLIDEANKVLYDIKRGELSTSEKDQAQTRVVEIHTEIEELMKGA